ncbi:MAG: MOSC domain-containing protein [Pseudomonadales bacterium]|nr:MOSC domain-containing protein [Pseudomonadales bacterium]
MEVSGLWRYPVKSMGGESLERIRVTNKGFVGDRAWALRDGDNTRNAKKFPALMGMRAAYTQGPNNPPTITLADGQSFTANDSTASARISEVVGKTLDLTSLAPDSDLEFYRRHERRSLEETRAILGLVDGEPLPDTSGFPARVAEFATPPGTFFDCYPVLVMTRSSLDALAKAAPASAIDVRRFRPNILLDTDQSGFVEAAWTGRRLRIGDVVLSLDVMCPRCVMTTVGFDDLPKDPGIMRTLVGTTNQNLGIYAEVLSPGEIVMGDEAVLE